MTYDVFLSYRYAVDRPRAVAMQKALQRIAKPWWKPRALRVFRDETGLPLTEGLWSRIEATLRDSRHLVLLAHPDAVASTWVNREIAVWRTLEPRRPLTLVLTGGDLAWDGDAEDFDWTVTNSIPRSLSRFFTEIPLYGDLRDVATDRLNLGQEAFFSQAVKVAAAVHRTTRTCVPRRRSSEPQTDGSISVL